MRIKLLTETFFKDDNLKFWKITRESMIALAVQAAIDMIKGEPVHTRIDDMFDMLEEIFDILHTEVYFDPKWKFYFLPDFISKIYNIDVATAEEITEDILAWGDAIQIWQVETEDGERRTYVVASTL